MITEQMYLDELKKAAMNPSQWVKETSSYPVRPVGFDKPIESDGVKYRTVCRKYSRWVVNGRILEPGDPAEPNPQPIFMNQPRRSIPVTI
jgi:hypothetical protein